jgi:hypothetical protein
MSARRTKRSPSRDGEEATDYEGGNTGRDDEAAGSVRPGGDRSPEGLPSRRLLPSRCPASELEAYRTADTRMHNVATSATPAFARGRSLRIVFSGHPAKFGHSRFVLGCRARSTALTQPLNRAVPPRPPVDSNAPS